MNKTPTKNRARVVVPSVLLVSIVLVVLFFVLRPAPPSAAEGPQERTFEVEIREGAMVPGEVAVDEGDRVNLRIGSDGSTDLHIHGYDLSAEAGPGAPAELSFDATTTGRFEIEDHASHPHRVVGELLVQPR